MDNILCGTYDIFLEGLPVGRLSVSQSGLMLRFYAACRVDSVDVFRLYCAQQGRPVPIGVLVPDGPLITLKRTYSLQSLKDMNLSSIEHCFLASSIPVQPLPKKEDETAIWRPVRDISSVFSDPEIKEICAGVRRGLVRSDSKYNYAAIPISPDEPFPMMPVFCFGCSEFISGKEYLVFRTTDGNLC